jgi:staphylococcal nuclease domain-containing protein 1
VYERLLELEELAKGAKRGLHSAKEVPTPRTNDVSQAGNAARARQYLPFFQRAGKLHAVVEYVLSGHRLKLYVPKEGVSIAFAPSGIKTPQRASAASRDRPAAPGEPFGDEAFAYTRENFMQREVEVEIDNVDKGGTFLGSVWLTGPKPVNLGVTLVRAGLARLQPFFSEGDKNYKELAAAQAAAKQARLKVRGRGVGGGLRKGEGEGGREGQNGTCRVMRLCGGSVHSSLHGCGIVWLPGGQQD